MRKEKKNPIYLEQEIMIWYIHRADFRYKVTLNRHEQVMVRENAIIKNDLVRAKNFSFHVVFAELFLQ